EAPIARTLAVVVALRAPEVGRAAIVQGVAHEPLVAGLRQRARCAVRAIVAAGAVDAGLAMAASDPLEAGVAFVGRRLAGVVVAAGDAGERRVAALVAETGLARQARGAEGRLAHVLRRAGGGAVDDASFAGAGLLLACVADALEGRGAIDVVFATLPLVD